MSVVGGSGATIVVEGNGVVLDEKEKKEEDDAVDKLLAGDVPLLVQGDAEGEKAS
jgi:hypothetical protein